MPDLRRLASAALLLLAGGCAVNEPSTWKAPELAPATPVQQKLLQLPPTNRRVAVAVYGFTDQTGQFKPSDTVQTLSRAVTQGATSILVKALQDAGNRQWFTIIERERLDNVLRERALIREMRQRYLGEEALNPQALPPLLFAGILLEGGIIGYDANIRTGGLGARYLGIGGNSEYREDTVTVYLRAVSTKTGEVLTSVNARKSIMSVGTAANAFRFVSFKDLLEFDAGVTYNEPDQVALQQAIEKAVHSLVMEGALLRLWCFQTSPAAGADLLRNYVAERDGVEPARAALPRDERGRVFAGVCPPEPPARAAAPPPPMRPRPEARPAAASPAAVLPRAVARPAGTSR